jgi:hypothetical protein
MSSTDYYALEMLKHFIVTFNFYHCHKVEHRSLWHSNSKVRQNSYETKRLWEQCIFCSIVSSLHKYGQNFCLKCTVYFLDTTSVEKFGVERVSPNFTAEHPALRQSVRAPIV